MAAQEVQPGPKVLGEVGVALAGLGALLTLGLLLALVLWVFRGRVAEGEARADSLGGRSRPFFQEALPQDRVRRAYTLALRALKERGLPRFPFEGPLDYQRRVTKVLPEASPFLTRLTALYLPVRYRGEAGEGEAEEAEAALKGILEACSTKGSAKA